MDSTLQSPPDTRGSVYKWGFVEERTELLTNRANIVDRFGQPTVAVGLLDFSKTDRDSLLSFRDIPLLGVGQLHRDRAIQTHPSVVIGGAPAGGLRCHGRVEAW